MNIIIATPILYDAKSPFNHLFQDIIEGFLSDGNQVTRIVACEKNDNKEYTYGINNNNIRYVEVIRKKHDKGNIIMRYITDSVTNIRMAWKILQTKDIDVLFEDVSYSSFWSVLAARIKGIKVISMIQDVWPDNAVQSGILTEKSFIYNYFEAWQKYVYKKSDKLICISEDIKEFIIQKGNDKDKISVIYNWGYSDKIIDISWDENEFVRKYNLNKDKFYAVYAGNIGKMQNVEVVVKTAQKLKDNAGIHFLIIGNGVEREKIAEMVSINDMANVTMLPMQPSELATSIYSMAGVNIIPLVKGGVKTALPSKTGICLSCGSPILLCLEKDSKYAQLIEQTQSGFAVESDDVDGAARIISNLSNGTIKIDRENVWKCFNENFNRAANIEKYKNAVKTCRSSTGDGNHKG